MPTKAIDYVHLRCSCAYLAIQLDAAGEAGASCDVANRVGLEVHSM